MMFKKYFADDDLDTTQNVSDFRDAHDSTFVPSDNNDIEHHPIRRSAMGYLNQYLDRTTFRTWLTQLIILKQWRKQ